MSVAMEEINTTNATTNAEAKEQRLVNVTSGEKSIYERKAEWGILRWRDGVIPIFEQQFP
jgi:hypothetical protein